MQALQLRTVLGQHLFQRDMLQQTQVRALNSTIVKHGIYPHMC